MTITIAERLRPFSHLPGILCLIPTTSIAVQAFPTLLRFFDLSTGEKKLIKEISFQKKGPFEDFTVFQDLEKGCVTVVGDRSHYHILPNLEIKTEKNPGMQPLPFQERLSLGSHKKQEWEMVKKRGDFREIFPLWFRLGMMTPAFDSTISSCDMSELLEACQKTIELHHPEQILSKFRSLFLAGFSGILVPRLFDDEYQGIIPIAPIDETLSPLFLLNKSAKLIRSLFFKCDSHSLSFLPNLPPEFFAGRFINVSSVWGELDFEWTKKRMRRIEFRCTQSGEITFHFPSSIADYRLRQSFREKGTVYDAKDRIKVVAGQTYFLDRFQK